MSLYVTIAILNLLFSPFCRHIICTIDKLILFINGIDLCKNIIMVPEFNFCWQGTFMSKQLAGQGFVYFVCFLSLMCKFNHLSLFEI